MRHRFALVFALVLILASAAFLVVAERSPHGLRWQRAGAVTTPGGPARNPPKPTPSPTPPPPAFQVPAGGVTKPADGTANFFGWALLDIASGKIIGSSDNADTGTNYVESMIKPWIAADYLNRLTVAGRKPTATDLTALKNMIIHSDDNIAQHYYTMTVGSLAGYSAVIHRLNTTCGLTTKTTPPFTNWWSYTRMTPDDAARLGLCIANGAAAGSYTTDLLSWMNQVVGGVDDQASPAPYAESVHTGGGHWGIIDGLPPALAAQASIKNGWEPDGGGLWDINCLAIVGHFVLSVMVKYPWISPSAHAGNYRYATNLQPGADACASVARQLTQPAG
jgi:hypothetical protein